MLIGIRLGRPLLNQSCGWTSPHDKVRLMARRAILTHSCQRLAVCFAHIHLCGLRLDDKAIQVAIDIRLGLPISVSVWCDGWCFKNRLPFLQRRRHRGSWGVMYSPVFSNVGIFTVWAFTFQLEGYHRPMHWPSYSWRHPCSTPIVGKIELLVMEWFDMGHPWSQSKVYWIITDLATTRCFVQWAMAFNSLGPICDKRSGKPSC